jgi:hypothetical protein
MNKFERINYLFFTNIGKDFDSVALHSLFGSAFRSRVSDVNRRSWYIVIKNRKTAEGKSVYWSEWRDAEARYRASQLEAYRAN